MVSDFFVLTPAERKKLGSDDLVKEEIQKRMASLTDFITQFVDQHTNEIPVPEGDDYLQVDCDNGHWAAVVKLDEAQNPCRFYLSRAFFNQMVTAWNTAKKISIDEQDWRYIIYLGLKSDGAKNLSWANCTLAICADIPPIICKG